MFDRFTDRARTVMGQARQQSGTWRHDYIGTEHVLLALLGMRDSAAVTVLKSLDVDLGQLRANIENRIEPGVSPITMGQIPFTPRAKRALEISLKEAANLGHNYIGTEHLIVALVHPECGPAAEALAEAGLDVIRLREGVLEFLASEDEESQAHDSSPHEMVLDAIRPLVLEIKELRSRIDAIERRLDSE